MARIPLIRKRWYPGVKVPGANHTIVVTATPESIVMDNPLMRVEVSSDGDYWVRLHSRNWIGENMWFDRALTASLYNFPYEGDEPALDWLKAKDGKLAEWGEGRTRGMDGFMGEDFEFTHFRLPGRIEGAAILWTGRSDYEVWLGDFTSFMVSQETGDPDEADRTTQFLRYNETLEGGLLWAYEQLGLIDRPELLPDFVRDALDHLAREARREAERRMGQRYLWEESES